MTTTLRLDHILSIENYRSAYPADHIAGLSDSMKRFGFKVEFAVSVIKLDALHIADRQPVYALIKGHCRTLAAREAGLTEIPAHIVENIDPAALALDQLSENENRRDPSDIDRAHGYQAALDKGASMADLCSAIGKHQDYVERRLSLLKLTADIQELVAKKCLPITYATSIVNLDSNRQRLAVQAYNKAKSPNIAEFQQMVARLFNEQVIEQQQQNFFGLFTAEEIDAKAESLAEEISSTTKRSVKALEAELEAEKKARKADREFAKAKVAQLLRRVAELEQKLTSDKAA